MVAQNNNKKRKTNQKKVKAQCNAHGQMISDNLTRNNVRIMRIT